MASDQGVDVEPLHEAHLMGGPGQRARIPYVASLDGVRAVAVAAVLLFHGGHLTGGYLGVDLFFVLSGYLITSLLLAETRTTGHIGLGAFWARRARRLLPALALMLFGVVLYATLVAQPAELHRIRYDALATLGYVANWREVFSHQDYWSLFTSPSPLDHTWSLAIEEQFYLVWPLLLSGVLWWGARHGGRRERESMARRVLSVSVVLAIASAALGIVLNQVEGSSRVYYGTDTRAAALLIGAALAALMVLRGPARTIRGRRALEVTGLLSAGVLAVAWLRMPGSSPLLYRGGLFVCSLAGAGLIAAASHPSQGPVARTLQLRPLVLLGLISYGAYLWHWPIFVWLNAQRTGLSGWTLFAVQVAVTLGVSTASFVLVERPIRRGMLGTRQLRALLPTTAGALVAAFFVSTAGAPIAEGSAAAKASEASTLSASRQAPADAPRLLVVVNSVAYFLAGEGFARIRSHPPFVVLNGAFPDCNFPSTTQLRTEGADPGVVGSVPCSTKWTWDADHLHPQVVLFTEAGSLGALRHDGRWLAPCTTGFDTWFTASLNQAVRTFTQSGTRFVIATSPYPQFYSSTPILWQQTACINRLEQSVERRNARVSIVDLARHVCPDHWHCRTTIDGAPMRPDGIHFRGRSAQAIAAWMLPQLGLDIAMSSRTGPSPPYRL